MGKFGFSKWSYRRAFGFSSTKGKISRMIGVPLTRAGRQRKMGRMMGCMVIPFVIIVVLLLEIVL